MPTTKQPRPEPAEHAVSGERTFTAQTVEDDEKSGDLQLEEDELPGDEDEDDDLDEDDEDEG